MVASGRYRSRFRKVPTFCAKPSTKDKGLRKGGAFPHWDGGKAASLYGPIA
jgi:hypothetical protein